MWLSLCTLSVLFSTSLMFSSSIKKIISSDQNTTHDVDVEASDSCCFCKLIRCGICCSTENRYVLTDGLLVLGTEIWGFFLILCLMKKIASGQLKNFCETSIMTLLVTFEINFLKSRMSFKKFYTFFLKFSFAR